MSRKSPLKIIAQNISYHNEVAENYDAIMDSHQPNQLIRERVKDKFLSLVPKGRVLDFGGGTGLDLEWLTAAGYEVVFCEPSVAMRRKAMEYNRSVLRSERICFLEGEQTDFTTWGKARPFSGEVDGALSDFGPLNYIPDIDYLFQSVSRMIKPGGYFVLLVLHLPFKKRLKWHRRNALRSFFFGSVFSMYIPYKEHKQMVFVYTEKEIRKASAPWFSYGGTELLEAHDFTLIHLIRNERAD